MGNEHSKNKELTKNGTFPEKHGNGSVKGLPADVTSNGLEIDVNHDAVVQKNGGTHTLNLSTETPESGFVIVETDKSADAPVIVEIPQTAIQKEEVKKNKEEKGHLFGKMFKKKAELPADVQSVQDKETSVEDQTDVSPPAADAQPMKESGSNGDIAAAVIIVEQRKNIEYLHQKSETSTQTDRKSEANISTQTGDDEDDTTTNPESPVEGEIVMETEVTEEDLLNEPDVIAEDVVKEIAEEEHADNQAAGIIIKEVVIMENDVYENMVFRAERVEVTDIFETSHVCEEERVSETEPGSAESNSNKSTGEGEIITEEINIKETVPQEISSSLPKVVADCIEVVFATDFAAVNTSEPCVDEVITEDAGEEATDESTDAALIESAEPEANNAPPEAKEANGIPAQDEEPVSTVMETISEIVCEKPNPTPENQDTPVEELSVPSVTEILVEVESAQEGIAIDDINAVKDVPGISEEFIIVKGPFNELITIEELPEDTLNSPDDEVQCEPISEVTDTDENSEVNENVIADMEPETVKDAETSPDFAKDNSKLTPEAAIDALSQEFELGAIIPQEPAVDNGIPLEEEVITATTFVPLSGEQEANLTIPEEPCEKAAEEMIEEAIEALSNEIEALPAEERADVPKRDVTGESEPHLSVQEELMEEDVPTVHQLLVDNKEPATLSAADLEEPADSNPVTSEEPVEESARLLEPQVLVVILEANEDEITEPSPDFVKVDAELTPEAAIDALTQAYKLNAITPQEPAVDNGIPLEEEVITATSFVPIPGEQEANLTIPEEPCEKAAEEMIEAIEALSNDTEAVPAYERADVPQTDATGQPEPCISVQEELVEENVPTAHELLEDTDKEPATLSALEEPTDSNLVTSEDPVKDSMSLLEPQVLVVILEANEDEVTEEIIDETENPGDVQAALDKNFEAFQIIAGDEPVAKCVEAVLETSVEEISAEDNVSECNLVTSEELASEIIAEEETEKKADNESSVNSVDSMQSAEMIEDIPVTCTDMEALLVRLQSACTTAVEESAYRLGGLKMSSFGCSITVTIHVAPEEEQQ